jgi:hypothetical protein
MSPIDWAAWHDAYDPDTGAPEPLQPEARLFSSFRS